MAIGSLNQRLQSDVSTHNPKATSSVRTDVSLVNTNVTDKLNELATIIANSARKQTKHDSEVLDITIGAITAEFDSLIQSKLIASDAPEPWFINTPTTDDVFSTIDQNIFNYLTRLNIKDYIANKSKIGDSLTTTLSQTVEKTLSGVLTKQTELYSKITTTLALNADITTSTLKVVKDHDKLVKPDVVNSNIFKRIAEERADRIIRRKQQSEKRRNERIAFRHSALIVAKMAINPVFAVKTVAHSKLLRDVRQEVKDRFSFNVSSDANKKDNKLSPEDASLFVFIKDSHVFSKINKLQTTVNSIYADLESTQLKATAYSGRALVKPVPGKTAEEPAPTFTKILAATAGAGLLAGIAVGLYKMWPILKRVFKTNADNSFAKLNPVLPFVEDFTAPPTNTVADIPALHLTAPSDELETDIEDASNKLNTDLTTAANDIEKLNIVDVEPLENVDTKLAESTINQDTPSAKKVSNTSRFTADEPHPVISDGEMSAEAFATDILGPKSEQLNASQIDQTVETNTATFNEHLDKTEEVEPEDISKLRDDINLAKATLTDSLDDFDNFFKHTKRDDGVGINVSDIATDIYKESVSIYKTLTMTDSNSKLLFNDDLRSPIAKISASESPSMFLDIAKSITNLLSVADQITNDFASDRTRLQNVDKLFDDTLDTVWDVNEYSLVKRTTLNNITTQINDLSDVLSPVLTTIHTIAAPSAQAATIKTHLNKFNSNVESPRGYQPRK